MLMPKLGHYRAGLTAGVAPGRGDGSATLSHWHWPRPPTAGGVNTGCRAQPCPRARRLGPVRTFLVSFRAKRGIPAPLCSIPLIRLQSRIVVRHANRVRIPLGASVAAIALLRCDQDRPVIFAALIRREMIYALPLRQRRLALQSIARAIDRRRHQDPTRQHGRHAVSEPHWIAYRGISVRPQASPLFTNSSNRDEVPHLFLTASAGLTPGRGDGSAVLSRWQGSRPPTAGGLNTGCRAQPCFRI